MFFSHFAYLKNIILENVEMHETSFYQNFCQKLFFFLTSSVHKTNHANIFLMCCYVFNFFLSKLNIRQRITRNVQVLAHYDRFLGHTHVCCYYKYRVHTKNIFYVRIIFPPFIRWLDLEIVHKKNNNASKIEIFSCTYKIPSQTNKREK